MRLAWIVAAVACSAATAPIAPIANRPLPRTPGEPFVGLFDRGRTWTLPIEVASGHHGDQHVELDRVERAVAQCTVTAARTIDGAAVAAIACAAPFDELPPTGTWIATRDGVYRSHGEPPDDASSLAFATEGKPWLATPPAESSDSGNGEESDWERATIRFERGWCVRDNVGLDGDRHDETTCIERDGLVGGTTVRIGIDWKWTRAIYGAAPRDPRDYTRAAR